MTRSVNKLNSQLTNTQNSAVVHLLFFPELRKTLSILIMTDRTVNYCAGFYHIMQRGRMTEVY